MTILTDLTQLKALYGKTGTASTAKEIEYIDDNYSKFIVSAPFVALATVGPEGIDCSPRGDNPGFVRIQDKRTLVMPDRRGNNRIDSLSNIIRDPRTSFMFMIPGSNTVLRVNGAAQISVDTELLASFTVEGALPRSAIVLSVERVYFQCARALMRSNFWNSDYHIDPLDLPTPGKILADISNGATGGKQYDDEWPERAKNTMW